MRSKQYHQLTARLSKSILLPITTKGKLSGSEGFAYWKGKGKQKEKPPRKQCEPQARMCACMGGLHGVLQQLHLYDGKGQGTMSTAAGLAKGRGCCGFLLESSRCTVPAPPAPPAPPGWCRFGWCRLVHARRHSKEEPPWFVHGFYLYKKFFPPIVQCLKGFWHRHIKHQHTAIRTPVFRRVRSDDIVCDRDRERSECMHGPSCKIAADWHQFWTHVGRGCVATKRSRQGAHTYVVV